MTIDDLNIAGPFKNARPGFNCTTVNCTELCRKSITFHKQCKPRIKTSDRVRDSESNFKHESAKQFPWRYTMTSSANLMATRDRQQSEPLCKRDFSPYMKARLGLLGLCPQMIFARNVFHSMSFIVQCLAFHQSMAIGQFMIVSLHTAEDWPQCVNLAHVEPTYVEKPIAV